MGGQDFSNLPPGETRSTPSFDSLGDRALSFIELQGWTRSRATSALPNELSSTNLEM